MKFLNSTIILLAFTLPLHANSSSCSGGCFSTKKICNQKNGHTLNSCDQDLFACQASCNSGKDHKAYTRSSIPFDVSIKPVLKMES